MVNYKHIFQRYVGSAYFTKDVELGTTAVCLRDNRQGGAAAVKTLHSTKTDANHQVATSQKLKITAFIVICNAQTAVIISEHTVVDTAGGTIKFSCLTPAAGQFTYPIDNIKFSAGTYVNVTVPAGNTLFDTFAVGHETTNL